MKETIVFASQSVDSFAIVLKSRVEAYFVEKGISKKSNALMRLKSVFYLTSFVSLYLLLFFGGMNQWAMLSVAALLGFFTSGIGFNVGHDAVHGAYSESSRNNRILSFAFDFIGASSYTWNVRHNIIHHTYTNIIGSDGDLESVPMLRFYLKPGRRFFHRFQHWYAPFLYGFVTLVWVLKKDYLHILEERRTLDPKRKPPVRAYVFLIFFKLLHYTLFLVLPVVLFKIAIWKVLLGFFVMHFVAGVSLAFVFQLAHCVEGPAFVHPTPPNSIPDSWASHQMKTTADFGPGFLTTWICGGLNYQIEHHLFPKICHIHYPSISHIVRKTAKEFGLPYYVHKSFFAAFCSHLRMLKFFGRSDPMGIPAQ